MTKEDLVEDINFWALFAEPQSEDNLDQLQIHYSKMFLDKTGEVPDFEIVDNKGSIKLLWNTHYF